MDAHLETVPGFATLTTGSFAGGDTEGFGGDAGGATDDDALFGCLGDDVTAG